MHELNITLPTYLNLNKGNSLPKTVEQKLSYTIYIYTKGAARSRPPG